LIYRKNIHDECPQGFKSDGLITDGKILISLEVERSQPHPDTNVGKYWYVYEKCGKYDKIVLIHVFIPTSKSHRWREALGEFYANKMVEYGIPLEYVRVDYREKHINSETALNEVIEMVKKYINQYMNRRV